jgi:hypothetical protein
MANKIMLGETILQYKIIEKLGEGGPARRSNLNHLKVPNDW